MTIAFLQGTGQQGASASSISKAFSANVAAGSLLVVGGVTSNADMPVAAVSDSRGNVWTRHGVIQRAAADRVGVWSAVSKDAGPCTVTLTPAAADFTSLVVVEFSGVFTADRVDVGFTSTSNASSTAVSTGNLVTRSDTALFALCTNGGTGTVTITPATGWTQIFEAESTASMPVNGVYRLAAPGTYNPAWTLGVSSPWTCGAVAFREGGTGTAGKSAYLRFPKPHLRGRT